VNVSVLAGESQWDPKEVNDRRLELMLEESTTTPSEESVLW